MEMVSPSVFNHLGSFWAHLDPFGAFQTRIDCLLRSTSAKPYFVQLGLKNNFCLKWSKRVQMGQIWFQMEKKFRLTILDPFRMPGCSEVSTLTLTY